MRRLIAPLVIVLVALGAFLWWWNQPERVVKRRVAGLFATAEIPADMGNIGRSARGAAIEPYLAKSINLDGPGGVAEMVEGGQSRSAIVSLYTALARGCKSATIKDLDITSVTVSGEEATVKATLDALIELQGTNRPVDGIQNLDMTWRKEDGDWKLSRAKWSEGARKP